MLTALLLFGLFILTSFGILYSAGISRRRIRVSIAQPLAALYETVGACGNPPKDQARTFAVYAIILTAVAWLVIPLAVVFAATASPDVSAPASASFGRRLSLRSTIGASRTRAPHCGAPFSNVSADDRAPRQASTLTSRTSASRTTPTTSS